MNRPYDDVRVKRPYEMIYVNRPYEFWAFFLKQCDVPKEHKYTGLDHSQE